MGVYKEENSYRILKTIFSEFWDPREKKLVLLIKIIRSPSVDWAHTLNVLTLYTG